MRRRATTNAALIALVALTSNLFIAPASYFQNNYLDKVRGYSGGGIALFTLIVLEVVLGIDNLLFISILTNKLPEDQRARRDASGSVWRSACASRCWPRSSWPGPCRIRGC